MKRRTKKQIEEAWRLNNSPAWSMYATLVAQQWYHGEQVLTELKRRLEILS